MMLEELEDVWFQPSEWRHPKQGETWDGYDYEECAKILSERVKEYCQFQKQETKELYEKTVRFYEEKAMELEKVEASLAKSKKQAQKTMHEHWEIITNSQWSPLNNPHVLQNVLSFLRLRNLREVMSTCSQMLYFVQLQVPVSVAAPDMGNKSFNKWITSFHHFRSLDCSSSKNMRKGSMYPNLTKIAKSKRIDGLKVSQAADFKPKHFEKFQQTFQKQKHLVELSVEASMIPCFLTDEQLGKLRRLSLLNLNKNNENVRSWIESFDKLASLEVLTITSYDYDLKNISIPANVRRLYIFRSKVYVRQDTLKGAKMDRNCDTEGIIAVPNLQNCKNLKEIWLDGVHDLTSLSLLINPLKVLKIRDPYFGFKNIFWPTSLHAQKLALSGVAPPPNLVTTKELTLAAISDSKVSQFASSPIFKQLSKFQLEDINSDPSLKDIVKWEHSLKEGAAFVLYGDTQFHPQHRSDCSRISSLVKYGLIEYAKFPNRCIIRSIPVHQAPDHWFYLMHLTRGIRQRSFQKQEVLTRVHDTLGDMFPDKSKKRKSPEGDDGIEGAPPLKKLKVDN